MTELPGTVRLLRRVHDQPWVPSGRDIITDPSVAVTYQLGVTDGAFQFRVSEVTLTVPDRERSRAAALFDADGKMLIWVEALADAGNTIHLADGWGLKLGLSAKDRRTTSDRRVPPDRRATCHEHHSAP